MSLEQKPQIVLLTGGGAINWIMANELIEKFGPITIICEPSESKKLLLKRRIKKMGYISVFGQVLFTVFKKAMDRIFANKRAQLVQALGGDMSKPQGADFIEVDNVNSTQCVEHLERLNPDLVFVMGTRLLKPATFNAIAAPFVNYHPGKTPQYRGTNPAYWTRVNRDFENSCVTFHLIDAGVDTGDIIAQPSVKISRDFNVATDFYCLAAVAKNHLEGVVEGILSAKIEPFKAQGPSKQYYHPTLWGYLWHGIVHKIW